MSDTAETDMVVAADTGDSGFIRNLVQLARRLERERDEARRECNEAQDGWNKALDERDEARRELAEIISCIEQAIDYHQVHNQFNSATAIKNLLENINQRRKHE